MNSLFETIFGQAKQNYLEAISPTTEVYDELFTKLPRQHRIYRMPYFSRRAYFTVDKGRPYLMTGLTSLTKKIQSLTKEDKFLEEWKMNMIKDNQDPDEIAFRASEFGTLIHIVAANLFSARARKESFSTKGIDKMLLDYMYGIGVSGYYFKEWYTNLCKAVLSLNTFYSKSEMEVLGIEYCVPDFKNNICTPLDIICEITTFPTVDVPNTSKEGTKRRKQESRERWNLNIKARAKSDRRSTDKYQLNAEMFMFNSYLPEFRVAKTGVLSPTWSWKTKENADCKLHDFTGDYSVESWQWHIDAFRGEPSGSDRDLFEPDLSQMLSDSNVFSVTEFGDVSFMNPISIEDFIMSHFKKDVQ